MTDRAQILSILLKIRSIEASLVSLAGPVDPEDLGDIAEDLDVSQIEQSLLDIETALHVMHSSVSVLETVTSEPVCVDLEDFQELKEDDVLFTLKSDLDTVAPRYSILRGGTLILNSDSEVLNDYSDSLIGVVSGKQDVFADLLKSLQKLIKPEDISYEIDRHKQYTLQVRGQFHTEGAAYKLVDQFNRSMYNGMFYLSVINIEGDSWFTIQPEDVHYPSLAQDFILNQIKST